MAAKLGRGGKGTFGATDVDVVQWEFTGTNDKQEVTTTGSAGVTEYIVGYNDHAASLEIIVDFAAPLTTLLHVGQTGTLELNMADSAFKYVGTAIVTGATITNAAKSAVTQKIDVQFTGSLTLPVLS